MEECDGMFVPLPKPTFEKRLEKYKNRMEFTRTMIGFIVLGIQIFIMYHLSTRK